MSEKQFKPLWRIHNRTYRKYAKGTGWKKWARYFNKALNLIRRMKHISQDGIS